MERVLVIRPGALGDIIVTLPAIQALARAGYQGGVELMGNSGAIDWLVGRSAVSSTGSFDRRELAVLFSEQGEVPGDLARYLAGFDLVVNYAAGASEGLSQNLRQHCSRVLELNVRPSALPGEHISVYLQRPLVSLGVISGPDTPRLTLLPGDRGAARVWLQSRDVLGHRLVAIHPGSGSPDKNWPAERYAEVVRFWTGRPETLVMLIHGPADDSVAAEVVRATTGTKVLELAQPALPLLAALLEVCQVYVGNDSGVSHLAAAMGTPSVVLFGPTDPGIWAPRGTAVLVLTNPLECSPCSAERRRSCLDHRCLRSISVNRVIAEMERALVELRTPRGSATVSVA